jgi:MoaA/NifB/PqqE/SkfB family radical SAM enzyme
MIQENKPQVRITWNIIYDCNYRCPYCFFEGKWDEYRKRTKYLSPAEWIVYWKRIYDKYGPSNIIITGGEPFLYPNFIELIKELSQISYHINISSNSSGDLEKFVEKIDPRKISLSLSYQPEFDSLEDFLERVVFLRKYNFDGCLNFVAWPPYLKNIHSIKDRFASRGEFLKIIPFFGEYHGNNYPESYTDEERKLVAIDETWFKKVKRKNSLCAAGQRTALVFPDGKVARCGRIGENMLLGNFFDSNFTLLDSPLPCEAEFCPCGEDQVLPEEKTDKSSLDRSVSLREDSDFSKISPLSGRQVIQENSLLNEDEYCVHKIILDSSPKAIFIQAAGPCNSNCVFCSRGTDYEIFDLGVHRQRFEEKLYPFIAKAEELILTGSGEFLLGKEPEKVLHFFDSKFPYVRKIFSTNGSSLSPEVCEIIAYSKSRYTIHISLHASNSRLHNVLTRSDNFYKVIGQLKYMIDLKRKTGNPELRLIFVATTLNIEDLPDFVRLASNLGVDRVICYYNYIYVPAQKYLSCFFKKELTNAVLSQVEELSKKLNMPIELPPKFGLEDYPTKDICREAWSQIMFTSLGHVLPCDASEDCFERLDEEHNFMDIWNSRYYQKLRKSLAERTASCFKYCLRANPESVNDFRSHVIRRGRKDEDINILWGDNF